MWEDEREIECPKHGSTFSLETGEPQTLPATKPGARLRRPRRGRRRDREHRRERAEDLGPPRDGRRAGDPARRRPRGAVGRGARADGAERVGQVDAVARADGPRRLRASPRGSVTIDGEELLGLPTHERAARGLFLALQYPVELPGVRLGDFLDAALRGQGRDSPTTCRRAGRRPRPPASAWRSSSSTAGSTSSSPAASRSGPRRCSSRCSQPKFAVLDEIDSGLDVDALRDVARRVEAMTNDDGLGVLAITHYARLLDELRPDVVHVLMGGRVVPDRRPRARPAARGDRLRRASPPSWASRPDGRASTSSRAIRSPTRGFEPQL